MFTTPQLVPASSTHRTTGKSSKALGAAGKLMYSICKTLQQSMACFWCFVFMTVACKACSKQHARICSNLMPNVLAAKCILWPWHQHLPSTYQSWSLHLCNTCAQHHAACCVGRCMSDVSLTSGCPWLHPRGCSYIVRPSQHTSLSSLELEACLAVLHASFCSG